VTEAFDQARQGVIREGTRHITMKIKLDNKIHNDIKDEGYVGAEKPP
jgi:hypothetical protein